MVPKPMTFTTNVKLTFEAVAGGYCACPVIASSSTTMRESRDHVCVQLSDLARGASGA